MVTKCRQAMDEGKAKEAGAKKIVQIFPANVY